MKLTQIKCVFCGCGKTGVPGEKPFAIEKRTNKLNPHTQQKKPSKLNSK